MNTQGSINGHGKYMAQGFDRAEVLGLQDPQASKIRPAQYPSHVLAADKET